LVSLRLYSPAKISREFDSVVRCAKLDLKLGEVKAKHQRINKERYE